MNKTLKAQLIEERAYLTDRIALISRLIEDTATEAPTKSVKRTSALKAATLKQAVDEAIPLMTEPFTKKDIEAAVQRRFPSARIHAAQLGRIVEALVKDKRLKQSSKALGRRAATYVLGLGVSPVHAEAGVNS